MSKIIFTEEGTKPPAPSVGQVSMYVKTDEVVYIQDSAGIEIPLGSSSAITSLTGEATGTGPGAAVITLSNSAVIGKVLTGFTSGPNSTVLATDTVLQAFQKLQAQLSASAGIAITSLTGDVSATGPGAAAATVNSVGGSSAANIHTAELATNAATSVNTASTIVKRDASGNFVANIITATLSGNASSATSASNVGGKTAADIANAVTEVDAATSSNTASTLVLRDASGNFIANIVTASLNGNVTGNVTGNLTGTVTGNVSGSAASFTGSLSGDVTGTQSATSISPPTVTSKVLTGLAAGTNTAIAATDSILVAFEKTQAQITATSTASVTAVTASAPLASSGGTTPNLTITQAATAANGYLSSTDWNTFNSKMANPSILVTQTVYVAVGGNDTIGDGSIGNPYLTVSKALSVITTAASDNRFMIKLMGGKIVDTTTPLLKPWVYIVGDNEDGTYWKVTAVGNSIGLDSSFATVGGARFGISNVYIGAGTNLNIDLHTIGPNTGTPSAEIDLENITVTGNLIFNGRVPDIDFLQMKGVIVFGNTNLDAAQNSAIACDFEGPVNLTSTNAPSNSQYSASVFLNTVTVSGSNTNLQQFTASPMFSTLTVSGATAIVSADSTSLPPFASQTVSGGASIALLGDSHNSKYTPTTPGNWTSVPTTVQQGLDTLATEAGAAITALTGDVTATGPGSAATTIAVGAVTDTKAALAVKPSVTVVATTNQTLSGTPTIDGQTTTANQSIILLTAQSIASQNGPWIAQTGAWIRPTWFPSGGTKQSFQFITAFVRLGTVYGGSIWRQTTAAPVTIDTTATTWVVTAVSGNYKSSYTIGTQAGSAEVDLIFANANTGTLAWNPTASYKVILPPVQGTAGTYLNNDGAGNLSWSNPVTNIDGGAANSVYTASQFINGGTP